MLLPVGLEIPAPPVHDQPALLDELGLVDVSGTDIVAFLVAHLPFNGCLRFNPDSISALQAIERNPCPQISVLVSYPIVRSALFTVVRT